jgi:hypothetical protein
VTHKQTIVKRQTLRREPRIGRWLDYIWWLNFFSFGVSIAISDVTRITLIPAFISITTVGALQLFSMKHDGADS